MKLLPVSLLATAVAASGAARADAPVDTLGDAIAAGKTSLELRYRLENIDQDGFANEADASTLRTRLRYQSAEWNALTGMVELDYVSLLGDERFNDTRNGETTYPTVVDPHGGDLNQAYVKYVGLANTVLSVGRQRVNFDNQRFVGSVGWRQNEQTLDATSLEFKGIDRLTATWDYVARVNRIYGPMDAPGATTSEFDGDTNLVNLKYVTGEKLTAVAYAYLVDVDELPALSSQTDGLRLTGKVPVGSVKIGYGAEYARQSDYKDNPKSFDVSYHLAELGVSGSNWELMAGHELLGWDSSAGVALQTPLATLHKFNGWADKFLTTPVKGLVDDYVSGTLTLAGYGFTLVQHQYQANFDDTKYGSELDAQVVKTFLKRYTLTLKYADYSADKFGKDTTKTWLMAEAKF